MLELTRGNSMEKRTEEGWKKKREYTDNYLKNNFKRFGFRVSKVTESDIIEWLEQQKSVYSYIKELIRKDMETNKD